MLFSVTLSLSPSQTHSVPLRKFLPFKEVRFVNENSLLEQGSFSADSESSLKKMF